MMKKSTILKTGSTVFACLFLLSSCATVREQSATPYAIEDQAGGYKRKVPKLLAEAEKLTGKKFKGRKITILKPESLDVGSVSELVARLKKRGETEGTIAWAAYDERTGTAFIQPIIARPPRWAMVHEFGYVVLMSNGIDGHPSKYADDFKYW